VNQLSLILSMLPDMIERLGFPKALCGSAELQTGLWCGNALYNIRYSQDSCNRYCSAVLPRPAMDSSRLHVSRTVNSEAMLLAGANIS
jgi:hypothetical protein